MPRISVLCGTGMSEFSNSLSSIEGFSSEKITAETPWGGVPLIVVSSDLGEVFVIDRHHSKTSGRSPPHSIEYRANVHAASSCSPEVILSINSVGSMTTQMPPGTVGVASDVLDLSTTPWTFHDDDAFHSDRTSPFDPELSSVCGRELEEIQGIAPSGLVVAQCVGPQFETPSEIDALERLGAHLVGMTLGPEQRLVSECSIPHVSLPCSSNWAAGRTPGDPSAEIDHGDVDEMASNMRGALVSCISSMLHHLGNN